MKNFYEVIKQLKKITQSLKKDIDKNGYPNESQLELIRSAKKFCMHESKRYQRMALMLAGLVSEYNHWEILYYDLLLKKEESQTPNKDESSQNNGCQPDTDTEEHPYAKKLREQLQNSAWADFLSDFGIDLTNRQPDTDTEEHPNAQQIREQAQNAKWEDFLSDFGIDMNDV